MNLEVIGERIAERFRQLDNLVLEAKTVKDADDEMWEALETGQDTEEAERSGALAGQLNGLRAAQTLFLYNLSDARKELDLEMPERTSDYDLLAKMYPERHGEPLYADEEWCHTFIDVAKASVESGGFHDPDTPLEVRRAEWVARAADAIAALSNPTEPREPKTDSQPDLQAAVRQTAFPGLTNPQLAVATLHARRENDFESLIQFEDEIAFRLNISLDATEQGFTPDAQRQIDKFVEVHRPC